MIHARSLIRDAVVALLTGGGTLAAARVYDHPYAARTTFPALVVEDLGEAQQAQTLPAGPNRVIERRLTLQVTAEVQQSSQYARARDELLGQVETLLASAGIAGVKSIEPTGFASDFSSEGDRPIALGRQRFEVLYYTAQGTPATTL